MPDYFENHLFRFRETTNISCRAKSDKLNI